VTATLTTLAFRVHREAAMIAFYRDAFGARFHAVGLGPLRIHVAEVGSVTLKFVPIRGAADFEGFPVHQPGFEVPDVARAIALALRHGGSVQNEPVSAEGRLHAAVRDPDGNTIELYGPAGAGSSDP
jgi:catechol 2,3-dioxygenase-like lactoylglutathione lyase family enzyme